MRPYLFFKRLLDIFFSLILIILLFPVMLVISILIRIDSKGPAIFVQTRVGHGKKEFRMYKFRTMRVGAEMMQKSLMKENEAHFPAFKIKNDPRLTAFGKKLRKTGLDELPQLWNILKGEMSFVGFRPPLPEEVRHYKKWHMRRFRGIPGILSFWVVEGEHRLTFDEWIKLDINYENNLTFYSDQYIFLKYSRIFIHSIVNSMNLKFLRPIFRHFHKRNKLKTIIFYVNYVRGLGHISRTIKLSTALCKDNSNNRVIILTDTKLIQGFHPNCEIIKLPSIEFKTETDNTQLVYLNKSQYEVLLSLRIKLLNEILNCLDPDLFFIDYRPKGLKDELEHSIIHLKKKPYLILRDILDDPDEIKKSWSQKRYIDFLKKQYSGILVFGDKKVFDLEKKYSFGSIANKIKYLGYIVNSSNYVISTKKRILITVGSGCIGHNIIRKVLDCGSFSEPVRVITGPAMKKNIYSSLVSSYPSVEFVKYEHDMVKEINEASLVISMGGYNTSTEILESDVPVLIVPLEEPSDMEQYIRAELFKKHNLCNYISYLDITKNSLKNAIREAKRISKIRKDALKKIRLDGGKNFARFVDCLNHDEK